MSKPTSRSEIKSKVIEYGNIFSQMMVFPDDVILIIIEYLIDHNDKCRIYQIKESKNKLLYLQPFMDNYVEISEDDVFINDSYPGLYVIKIIKPMSFIQAIGQKEKYEYTTTKEFTKDCDYYQASDKLYVWNPKTGRLTENTNVLAYFDLKYFDCSTNYEVLKYSNVIRVLYITVWGKNLPVNRNKDGVKLSRDGAKLGRGIRTQFIYAVDFENGEHRVCHPSQVISNERKCIGCVDYRTQHNKPLCTPGSCKRKFATFNHNCTCENAEQYVVSVVEHDNKHVVFMLKASTITHIFRVEIPDVIFVKVKPYHLYLLQANKHVALSYDDLFKLAESN